VPTPTTATIAKFIALNARGGGVTVTKSGLSRGALENLVAAGIARRVEAVGAGYTGQSGVEAVTHRPSRVAYALV